jgi:anti-sigma factor RsiW
MTVRTFEERDIHLALDGELPAEERPAFEAWLASRPDMQAKIDRFAADAESLREALAPALDEPVPAKLMAILSSGAEPRKAAAAKPFWRALAAAVLLAIGLLGGYFAGSLAAHPSNDEGKLIADSAIAAHDIYSREKLHVVEVAADQREHLLGWLSKRVGLTLVAPDLASQGYDLIGGRLLPLQRASAAQFMYQDEAGNRISLYVARDPGNADTGFRYVEEGSTRALYWMDDGYGCAVAGDVSHAKLQTIADLAYTQLLEGLKS